MLAWYWLLVDNKRGSATDTCSASTDHIMGVCTYSLCQPKGSNKLQAAKPCDALMACLMWLCYLQVSEEARTPNVHSRQVSNSNSSSSVLFVVNPHKDLHPVHS